MVPYKVICFDIVGGCNASCPYCVTGRGKERVNVSISPEKFQKVISILKSNNLLDIDTMLYLYSWGEPMMHPALPALIEILNNEHQRFTLSTNGSIVPHLDENFVRNLGGMIFSMPGFSQGSYDRINRLNFDRVRQNIMEMSSVCHKLGFKGSMSISYHIYQFNIAEMTLCRNFARQNNIFFKPCYAILNDWDTLQGWIKGGLDHDQMRKISEDLFCFNIREMMSKGPLDYWCPQWDYLVLNENADVVTCCQLPSHDPASLCGNLLEDQIGDILQKKKNQSVCLECVRSGLAYYLNNALKRPDWCDVFDVQTKFKMPALFRIIKTLCKS